MASGGNHPELFEAKQPRAKIQDRKAQPNGNEGDTSDEIECVHLCPDINSTVPCLHMPDASSSSCVNGHSSLVSKKTDSADTDCAVLKSGKLRENNNYDLMVNGVIELEVTNHSCDAAGHVCCTSVSDDLQYLNSCAWTQINGGARPKVLTTNNTSKPVHKCTKKSNCILPSESGPASTSDAPHPGHGNNATPHNDIFSSIDHATGIGRADHLHEPHTNISPVTGFHVNGICNKNKACLPNAGQEQYCVYGNGQPDVPAGGDNFDIDEAATDMIDEGAVCDFDKLVDWHNVPPLNGREDTDDINGFYSYSDSASTTDIDFPDGNLYMPCSSRICDTSGPHSTNYLCGHHSPLFHHPGAHSRESFDTVDHASQHSNLYCDNPETPESCDDTGDFIDADLPDKALRLLSSSAGSSSLSSCDEDEMPLCCVSNPVFGESKENNLSLEGFRCAKADDGPSVQRRNHCCSGDSVHCARTGQIYQRASSESENEEEYSCHPVASFVNSDNHTAEGASGYDNHSDSPSHHGVHSSGGGTEHCTGILMSSGYFLHQHSDLSQYITASSGSVPSLLPMAMHHGPPGSASSQLSSDGMSSCVNNLSQSMSFPMDLETVHGCQGYYFPSNFQNDESNTKQKVFFKVIKDRGKFVHCVKRDASHLNSTVYCEHALSSHVDSGECGESDEVDQSFFPDVVVTQLASELDNVRVNSESGVSEPIYEDIECFPDCDEYANMAAASESSDHSQKIVDLHCRKSHQRSVLRRRDRVPNGGSKSGIEKVMIWKEYEAFVLQVKQIGTSACGPTAVLNVLRAFDVTADKDEVCKRIHTNLREESAHIPQYLFSRAVAGTTAEDLLHGIESLTDGKIRGRFFHFWPPRDINLLQWLGQWMKKGAVPFVTLNLQKGVKPGWTIPDAWHHQMVYGVSSKGLYLTNPLEIVPEEVVLEQLVSNSVLLVRRQDIVDRHRDTTDLGDFLRHPDSRWRTMNVLGQVINVLREDNMTHVPGYRAQLTSHISIPAVYKAGITLLVNSQTDLWQELQSVSELPIRDGRQTCNISDGVDSHSSVNR
ncbi:uncharacterized protein LOC121388732 [Gigantopelta aegis]|uniref:uncharacterized protein LOC121388732 n=1 Tax=Gigantopelta aegis TaxID=1735272 RepID=UPI001B88C47A|nr:uncharacterized protein LOC121388732 [Gigantopelta aegis]